ncbi:MAG: hypothetical protein P4M07_24800 [Xanthobacteraceae bacterium]|nr:hypothetical protein [Xanthobacteraceae bacterium]
MAVRAPAPWSPDGFAFRVPRRDRAAAIVCASLLLGIVMLVLRIASVW